MNKKISRDRLQQTVRIDQAQLLAIGMFIYDAMDDMSNSTPDVEARVKGIIATAEEAVRPKTADEWDGREQGPDQAL